MVGGIGDTTLASIPGIDLGAGAGTSQQQQQQGKRSAAGGDSLTLSPEAQQQISKLQQRDREVRSHEQSHISAGGSHVNGGASYTYQRGPDNRQYAVGGSVSIDTSPVPGNPEATKEKARRVRSAALAPSSPSAQDQSVAAAASSLETQAQQDAEKQSPTGSEKAASPSQNSAQPLFSPAGQIRPADYAARAAAAYQSMQQQSGMPTQLAPWGTGLAITV